MAEDVAARRRALRRWCRRRASISSRTSRRGRPSSFVDASPRAASCRISRPIAAASWAVSRALGESASRRAPSSSRSVPGMAVCQPAAARPVARERAGVEEQVRQLLDEERHAVGSAGDVVDDVGRRLLALRGASARCDATPARVSRGSGDRRDVGRIPGRGELRARREENAEPRAPIPPLRGPQLVHEERRSSMRRRVGPVEVLDHEDPRALRPPCAGGAARAWRASAPSGRRAPSGAPGSPRRAARAGSRGAARCSRRSNPWRSMSSAGVLGECRQQVDDRAERDSCGSRPCSAHSSHAAGGSMSAQLAQRAATSRCPARRARRTTRGSPALGALPGRCELRDLVGTLDQRRLGAGCYW